MITLDFLPNGNDAFVEFQTAQDTSFNHIIFEVKCRRHLVKSGLRTRHERHLDCLGKTISFNCIQILLIPGFVLGNKYTMDVHFFLGQEVEGPSDHESSSLCLEKSVCFQVNKSSCSSCSNSPVILLFWSWMFKNQVTVMIGLTENCQPWI